MTVTSLDARTRRRDANHEVIASTALALASEHGLDGFTVDDLARAAGISRRTFFNHFASKEEAVVEVARLQLGRVLAHVEVPSDDASALRILDACVRALLDPATVHAVRAIIPLARANPALVPHLAAIQGEALEQVAASSDSCGHAPGTSAVHRVAYPGAVLATVAAVYKRQLHVIEVDGPPATDGVAPVLSIAELIDELHQLLPPNGRGRPTR